LNWHRPTVERTADSAPPVSEGELVYTFGDSGTPTETDHSPVNVDVDVDDDGVKDGVAIDMDHNGHWDHAVSICGVCRSWPAVSV